ncbi:MAG: YceD family protein [Acutalibacteraceae bacterium]
MILDLKKIFLDEDADLSVQTKLDLSEIKRNGIDSFPEPVSADIRVCNRAGIVIFECDVAFDYKFRCDRCAVLSDRKFACKFRHILVTELSDESGDDYIEAPDYKLDTDALLRDDILLELPSKFLCKESCKGLCPKCGKNLNEGECNCDTHEPDPRLAVLKQLLSE